ncbi:Prolyl carboxy peptidase like protein 5 [Diplonema papillatum]|nr:Prolyl carboxy peptidase like protein 5 [Diplonema papillatum]
MGPWHAMLCALLLLCGGAAARLGEGRFVQRGVGAGQPTTANCTWATIDQPLDHTGGAAGTFKQRYCVYDKYWAPARSRGFGSAPAAAPGPIFFYTGNESPVGVYINNTGLMWTLAEDMGALIVFAEHRYEGESVPRLHGVEYCMSYATTSQALMDYAALIRQLQAQHGTQSPVIAFGGSYGGMLAGWMRYKYPEVIAGAIAASAPVNGLAPVLGASNLPNTSQAISRGVSAFGGATDTCFNNLLAAWPAIKALEKAPKGLELLSKAAKRCGRLVAAQELIDWAQAVWFYMAEGNFPFPSTYVSTAVGSEDIPLPAWPMRAACSKGLNTDYGLRFTGNLSTVNFTVHLEPLEVDVVWEKLYSNAAGLTPDQIQQSRVLELVSAVTEAAGVWYNITGDVTCYSGLNEKPRKNAAKPTAAEDAALPAAAPVCGICPECVDCPPCPLCNRSAALKTCTFEDREEYPNAFCWNPVVCNEDVTLVNTVVHGVGGDMYWPPNVPANYTMETVAGPDRVVDNPTCTASLEAQGLFGTPTKGDNWAHWLTAYYASGAVLKTTNVVWSNGALDPWSGGGVYPVHGGILGPVVQNISESSASLVIPLGAHHLDLFFPSDQDPPDVQQVRQIEASYIRSWASQHYDKLGQ